MNIELDTDADPDATCPTCRQPVDPDGDYRFIAPTTNHGRPCYLCLDDDNTQQIADGLDHILTGLIGIPTDQRPQAMDTIHTLLGQIIERLTEYDQRTAATAA